MNNCSKCLIGRNRVGDVKCQIAAVLDSVIGRLASNKKSHWNALTQIVNKDHADVWNLWIFFSWPLQYPLHTTDFFTNSDNFAGFDRKQISVHFLFYNVIRVKYLCKCCRQFASLFFAQIKFDVYYGVPMKIVLFGFRIYEKKNSLLIAIKTIYYGKWCSASQMQYVHDTIGAWSAIQ